MPIIIWGSRALTSTKDTGRFYCPQCDREEEYDLKKATPYFTLYFIPLFPNGTAETYVECRSCHGTFKEAVLEYEPPTDEQRFFGAVYNQLRGGRSIEDVRDDLVRNDFPADKAEAILTEMCEGSPVTCDCGHRYHSQVKRCSNCGIRL